VDENGLGARLGPLVVTAVLARVSDCHSRIFTRKLPKRVARDLDDSKRLVSHGDIDLGEAWARAVVGPDATTPEALLERLSLEGTKKLRESCPKHVEAQCWARVEAFAADAVVVERLSSHLAWLRDKGVDVLRVRSSVLCSQRLNGERAAGKNRFISDLHAMERLVLDAREHANADVYAVCGKVGGMGDYSRFFGPLSYRLHTILRQGKARSEYYFPGLGEVHFVRDADARDPLVMLASLIGKYVRELLLGRVADHYRDVEGAPEGVSGYHDPITKRFVEVTRLVRRQRAVPDDCFERATDEGGFL
jgi:ribonuclease HII